MKTKLAAGALAAIAISALTSVAFADPVTVTFWGQALPPTDQAAVDQIIKDYEAKHPDVTIKWVPVSSTETDESKLMTAVRGGVGPDVYYLNRFAAQQRASEGLLENLKPYMDKEGVDLSDKYLPFAWGDVANDKGVFALPFDTDARVIFYNKKLLQDAGVDLKPFDPANGPMTPDAMNAAAAKVNQKDASGNYEKIGFVPWFEQGWHYTWGLAFNGTFQDGGCKVTPTTDGAVAGMKFLQDSANALGYPAASQFLNSYYPPNSPAQSNPFFTGRIAMMVNGDWMLPQMTEYGKDIDWAMTYIPTPDGHITSWSAGWSLAIPTGAKNVQAAYDFARYMTGEEGQHTYVKMSQHLPTWKSLLDEGDLFQGPHAFFKELLPHSNPLFQLPVGALYWDELTRAQGNVLAGTATPADAMAEAGTRTQAQLDRACAK